MAATALSCRPRSGEAPRPRGRVVRALAGLVALVLAGPALAQSPACDSYRAQLAALERSAGADPRSRDFENAARRQEAELTRTIAYARQMGCDRQASFFGGGPPPECGPINARISQMRGNLAQLEARASGFGGGAAFQQRRAQLLAAIDQACRPQPQAPRNLFEALFGVQPSPNVPSRQAPLPEVGGPFDDGIPGGIIDDRPRGGSRAVCVRTCDGFFFPVSNAPGGRESLGEMCQALCPGQETKAFFMSPTGDIEGAVGVDGQPYTSLANAGRYQRSFDPNCGCRKPGESWAQVLQQAEALLDRRKGDILVTEAKAEELSRAKAPEPKKADPRKPDPRQGRNARKPEPAATATTADPAIAQQAAIGAQAPTASQESSGIGPRNLPTQSVVGKNAGETREVVTADGEKRVVRVIGSGMAPAVR
jgi:hypothetical protein